MGQKTIIARDSNGKVVGYGNVDPIEGEYEFPDLSFGSELDTDIWGTNFKANANYSVNNGECGLSNVAGSLHSGGTIYTKNPYRAQKQDVISGSVNKSCKLYIIDEDSDSFDEITSINQSGSYSVNVVTGLNTNFKVSFKWKPHMNHHGTAAMLGICFTNGSTVSIDTTYYRPDPNNSNNIMINLGNPEDTTSRSRFIFHRQGSTDVSVTLSPAITVSQWYDVEFLINRSTNRVTFSIDSTTYSDISVPFLSGIDNPFLFSFYTADYNKNNTEYFKDFVIENA